MLTEVFEVNEKAELLSSYWKPSRVQDGQEGWWWWNWPSDQMSMRRPEDRIPSLLPRLEFCAREVFNFVKSQLHSVGSVLFPFAHRFSDCPDARAWGGGWVFGGWEVGRGINRKAACLFDKGEAKLEEREWGEIVKAIDIWVGIIHDTWALELQPLSTWFRITSICGLVVAHSAHSILGHSALVALTTEKPCQLIV